MKALSSLVVLSGQTIATTDSTIDIRLYFQNMHDEAFLKGKGFPQPQTADVAGKQFVEDVTNNPDNKRFDFAGLALGLLYKETYDELTKSKAYGVYMGYCHPEFVWLLYDVTKWTPNEFPNRPGEESTKPILISPDGVPSGEIVKAQSHCTGTSGRAGVVASFTANENTSAAEFMSRRKKKRMVVAVMHWDHTQNPDKNQEQLARYLGTMHFDLTTDELLVLADTNCDKDHFDNYLFLQNLYSKLPPQTVPLPPLATPHMLMPGSGTCCTDDGFMFQNLSSPAPEPEYAMNFVSSDSYRFDRFWSTLDLKSEVAPVQTATLSEDPYNAMWRLDRALDIQSAVNTPYHKTDPAPHGPGRQWGALKMHKPIRGIYTL